MGYHGHGKSTIWSAAQMVLLCKPWPEYEIHSGETKGSVKITMSNGIAFTRLRSKSENLLVVEEPGKESVTYRNPLKMLELVSRLSGFKAIQLDQKTFESVQLVSSGAAQNFMQNVSPETMLKRVMSLVSGSELEEIKNQLKADLALVEGDLKVCNGVIEFSDEQIAGLDRAKIEASLALLLEAEAVRDEIFAINESLEFLKAEVKLIDNLVHQIEAMEHIALKYTENWEEANALMAELETARKQRKEAWLLLETIDNDKELIAACQKQVDALDAEHSELSSLLSKFPTCETCGQPV